MGKEKGVGGGPYNIHNTNEQFIRSLYHVAKCGKTNEYIKDKLSRHNKHGNAVDMIIN